MVKKSTAIIVLVFGMVLVLAGLIMSFIKLDPIPSWYNWVWELLIGLGLFLLIIGAVMVSSIKEIPEIKTPDLK